MMAGGLLTLDEAESLDLWQLWGKKSSLPARKGCDGVAIRCAEEFPLGAGQVCAFGVSAYVVLVDVNALFHVRASRSYG